MNNALKFILGLSVLVDLALAAWAGARWDHFQSTWLPNLTQLPGLTPGDAQTGLRSAADQALREARLLGFVLALCLVCFAAIQALALRWVQREREQGHHTAILFGAWLTLSSILVFAFFRRPEFLLIDGVRGVALAVVAALALHEPSTVRELRLPDRARGAGSRSESRGREERGARGGRGGRGDRGARGDRRIRVGGAGLADSRRDLARDRGRGRERERRSERGRGRNGERDRGRGAGALDAERGVAPHRESAVEPVETHAPADRRSGRETGDRPLTVVVRGSQDRLRPIGAAGALGAEAASRADEPPAERRGERREERPDRRRGDRHDDPRAGKRDDRQSVMATDQPVSRLDEGSDEGLDTESSGAAERSASGAGRRRGRRRGRGGSGRGLAGAAAGAAAAVPGFADQEPDGPAVEELFADEPFVEQNFQAAEPLERPVSEAPYRADSGFGDGPSGEEPAEEAWDEPRVGRRQGGERGEHGERGRDRGRRRRGGRRSGGDTRREDSEERPGAAATSDEAVAAPSPVEAFDMLSLLEPVDRGPRPGDGEFGRTRKRVGRPMTSRPAGAAAGGSGPSGGSGTPAPSGAPVPSTHTPAAGGPAGPEPAPPAPPAPPPSARPDYGREEVDPDRDLD